MSIESTPLKIIQTIFHMEMKKGHLKWSISEVSRRAKISRTTIYYYFGTSKAEILQNSLQCICDEFYGTAPDRLQAAKTNFAESAKFTRDLYSGTPEFAVFYQLWRFKESEYQKILINFEKQYQKKLAHLFPDLSPKEIIFFHASLHGLMTAPFMSRDNIDDSLAILQKLVKK